MILLWFVIASSRKHGDMMRRTFVVQEGMILIETGMGWSETLGTPTIAHHCTMNLTRLLNPLTRPCPGRVACHVCCAPVCAEQACDNGRIRGSAALFREQACGTRFGILWISGARSSLLARFEAADCGRCVKKTCPLRRR